MLHIYYGRENIDKDRFMFDQIREELDALAETERVILMVPDQFTLQAERNAFECLGVEGLMDLEVLSQTRLGTRVIGETGGSSRIHIDRYGRHMLFAKIVAEEEEELKAFRGMKQAASFIELINDLVIELKQFNTDPTQLPEIIDGLEEHSLLRRKLEDVYRIYSKYEERIAGKYMDTEDYMSLFVSAVGRSRMIKESRIWIAGFDSFTPKSLLLLRQLMIHGMEVNVVLTSDPDSGRNTGDRDLFLLARKMASRLTKIAAQAGIDWSETAIPEEYRIGSDRKAAELLYLEQELYSYPNRPFTMNGDFDEGKITAIRFCRASNFYTEAETVASAICDLVREGGLRYRDIAVICNDTEGRGSVIRRVFEEYEIPSFIDQKRSIVHHPAVEFILALLDIVQEGWRYEDVFRLLKTGLTEIGPDQWEDLENYAVKYRIRGRRWKKAFVFGTEDEGEEQLAQLNLLRERLTGLVTDFEKGFRKEKTARGKVTLLYEFLRDRAELPRSIEGLIDGLNLRGEYEAAEESAQIWTVIINLLDQMVELMGEDPMETEAFSEMLRSGFEAVEIGLIPPTLDQVIVGTMQRTRTGAIQALFVMGANDGLLPMASGNEALLSEDEKAVLLGKSVEICKNDEQRVEEERLAIYRNLSKPSRFLWVGYAAADLEGKELRPSMIYEKLRRIFPMAVEEKDLLNQALDRGEDKLLIEKPVQAAAHLVDALRASGEGQALSGWWKETYRWFRRGEGRELDMLRAMEEGLLFQNRQERLERRLVDRLYKKEGLAELLLSPSRLERFSRCPFAHFVQYGLRPAERRIFEVAGREVGDVYHECLMRLSGELTVPGMEITAEDSPWMRLTEEECGRRIEALIREVSQEYREGMLSRGEEERYRASRMKDVCSAAAWALVSHVRQGRIREVFFEAPFGGGREKAFPPIEVSAGGETVRIEGKIDRVDVLPGEASSYVKIIDYKSGKERFDVDEARGGWRLQLMIYLKAAMNGVERREAGRPGEQVKPAGVFYFEIAEPMVDASGWDGESMPEEEYRRRLEAELKRGFKLDGVLLDQEAVVSGIAGDLEEGGGYSQIAPVKKSKDGVYSGTSEQKLLSEEQFTELRAAVDETVSKLCEELVGGKLDVTPKKTKYETACRFCQYRSVCNFDLAFEGCRYERI